MHPNKQEIQVVIFGTGRFLRGFVADLLQDALNAGRFRGCAVMVQSTGTARADALTAAGGRYRLAVRGRADGRDVDEVREIDVVRGALAAGRDWEELVGLFESPGVAAVFSNVTESGLAQVEAANELPRGAPGSFGGKLTALLHARWRALGDRGGIAVLPCELVDDNGEVVRRLVLQTAAAWGLGDEFAAWVDERVAFVTTLVDRIVTEPGDGDPLSVVAEPFRMCALSRPARARAAYACAQGWFKEDPTVTIAEDIGVVARRKIRLLNGAHTACAPVAALLGVKHFRSFAEGGGGAALVERVVFGEALPTLGDDPAAGAVARALSDRFCNPYLDHRVLDIAAGSVAKARARLLTTMVDAAANGNATPGLALGVAAILALHAPRGLIKGLDAPVVQDAEEAAVGACWAGYALDGTIASVAEVALGDGGPLCVKGGAKQTIVDAVGAALAAVVDDGVEAALEAAVSSGVGARTR
jgi:tagaturonate reductase